MQVILPHIDYIVIHIVIMVRIFIAIDRLVMILLSPSTTITCTYVQEVCMQDACSTTGMLQCYVIVF